MKRIKVIVEKHPDGYIAYPLGLKGVVVGEGDFMRMLWPMLSQLSVSISRLLVVRFWMWSRQFLMHILLKRTWLFNA